MLEPTSYLNASLLLAQEAEEASEGLSVGMKMLFILGVVVAAFVLGWAISTALKMKDKSGTLTGVLLALFIGASPFVFLLVQGKPLKDALKLGIDLAGGTNMVFQVDEDKVEEQNKEITGQVMDQMVASVIKRLNPSGTEEITVRKVGSDRIEVIIPGVDRELIKAKKDLISRLGSLEFAILANRRDHSALGRAAGALPPNENNYYVGNQLKASWRDPGIKVDKDGNTKPKTIGDGGEVITRSVEGRTQYLVIEEPEDRKITGEHLSGVMASRDKTGGPAVSFQLDPQGARNMRRLTSQNLPSADKQFFRRLAILLDGNVHQAPNINETLSRSIQVSGLDNQAEVKELISVLNAGALEVPLKKEPISEFSISPTLGADVRAKGLFAIKLAAFIVFGFMLIYYLRAGVIADLGLLLNLVLVVGAMSIFSATFTLPGLAGLVLTIGMAVDANVLIFERIREEKDRGSSQRMAIQNGFGKALSTIIDANVTTLITAVILYIIGTDQVKGFAVALFIGIVMSVFSALIFGRLMFDIGERKKILGNLGMLSIVGRTNINFLSGRKVAALVSGLLIAGGMFFFVMRGTDNLDIDFTGGTMITFELEEPAEIGDVKEILEEEFGSITLERLTAEGETGDIGNRYRMRTKDRDADRQEGEDTIQTRVGHAFEGQDIQPRKVTVQYGELEPIAAAEPEEEAPESPETAPPEVPFAGGHSVTLTFSEAIPPTTAEIYVIDSLIAKLETIDESDAAEDLFEITGIQPVKKDETDDGPREADGQEDRGAEGSSDDNQFVQMQLKVSDNVSAEQLTDVLVALQATMADNPTFDEVNSFDSSVAGEMQQDAVMAILASLVAIVFYIWLRFDKVTFGLAAVAALVHDVLVVLGMVAIASYLSNTAVGLALDFYDFKINLPMVAAFLTIVGYSLNDTIVVFDRIREVRGKNPAMTTSMVNLSLNQTLSRTLLTSLTTLMVVVILYFFGGEGIHGFAFCLVLGVLVGTYSSVYVASPVLLWLINRPGSEIGVATAKAEAEEQAKLEKQTTASVSV